MSQEVVLLFLERNEGKKYTAAQLIYHLKNKNMSGSVIFANLRRLRGSKMVNWIWGEELNEKSRPARYYFHKKEGEQ